MIIWMLQGVSTTSIKMCRFCCGVAGFGFVRRKLNKTESERPDSGVFERAPRMLRACRSDEGNLMSIDLSLPTFALDCQDWLVTSEVDSMLPEDVDEMPVLVVLSTALIGTTELESANAVFSLGLMDDTELDMMAQSSGHGVPSVYIHETDWADGHARMVIPTSDGYLAVIAEFSSAPDPSPKLVDRFHSLVSSFRWTV
jgi:hypothetical protein